MFRMLMIGLLMAGMSLVASAGPRQAVQRAQIRQGVRDGSLTRAEAARLRAGLGGNLGRNSRAIRRLKRNARVR